MRESLMPHEHQLTPDMRRCIDNCIECHKICNETITHCLLLGGKHASAEHIALLMDCADICATSARFMLHGSHHHERTCAVCAEVCEACAKDCEQMAKGDETMMRCAKMCRACADSCHKMAGAFA